MLLFAYVKGCVGWERVGIVCVCLVRVYVCVFSGKHTVQMDDVIWWWWWWSGCDMQTQIRTGGSG